jgi:serine/threonine protein kinase
VDPVIVGPYTLVAPLAQGGMGAVHFAVKNESIEKRPLLLIKTLKSSLVEVADYAGRFNDEAKVALRLRHKNLCEVFDAGEDHGTFYLAMELIEGVTFKRMHALLDQHKRKLTSTEATALGVALLRGLHAAHVTVDDEGKPLGVVHRDVSPHNTMLDKSGRVKVIDYGLATSVLKETFTESMVALGKAGYIAPEQARGEDVSQASDQYSAAIVIYELFTGDRYYGELNSRSIWTIAGSGVHKPRSWERVPEPFRAPLQRALSAKAALRFDSCAAFADALVAIEPKAEDSERLPSLRSLVADLAPPELLAVEDARAVVERLEEITERTPTIVNGVTVEATQIVRTKKRGDEDTTSTRVRTLAPAALASPPRRPRAKLLAAAGVVVACLGVATVTLLPGAAAHVDAHDLGGAVVAPAVAPMHVASVAPAPHVVEAATAPPVVEVAHKKPPVDAAAVESKHKTSLLKRADAVLSNAACPPPSKLLVSTTRDQIRSGASHDLTTFERVVSEAESQCSAQ